MLKNLHGEPSLPSTTQLYLKPIDCDQAMDDFVLESPFDDCNMEMEQETQEFYHETPCLRNGLSESTEDGDELSSCKRSFREMQNGRNYEPYKCLNSLGNIIRGPRKRVHI